MTIVEQVFRQMRIADGIRRACIILKICTVRTEVGTVQAEGIAYAAFDIETHDRSYRVIVVEKNL